MIEPVHALSVKQDAVEHPRRLGLPEVLDRHRHNMRSGALAMLHCEGSHAHFDLFIGHVVNSGLTDLLLRAVNELHDIPTIKLW